MALWDKVFYVVVVKGKGIEMGNVEESLEGQQGCSAMRAEESGRR